MNNACARSSLESATPKGGVAAMKLRNRLCLCVEELEGRLVPSTLTYSTNWSGYALSTPAGAVSHVAGNWKVPAVASTNSGYSSAWVGIDGWSNGTVEQIGTDSDYLNGHARYYAWYEMYPAAPVNLTMTITPGDTISATVDYVGSNQFALSITNVTTNSTFSTTQTSSTAQLSSAEWIQEAPSSFTGVLPLANFGTINFSGANATVNGTNSLADNAGSGTTLFQVDMANRNGSLKTTTSTLSDAATPAPSSFSVTFVSSGSKGGGGNGHKTTNVPPAISFPTAAFQSATIANTAASPQVTTHYFAPQPIAATVAPTASVVSPTLSVSSSFTATFVRFGPDGSDQDSDTGDGSNMQDMTRLNRFGAPVQVAARAENIGPSTPRASQTPVNLAGANVELSQAPESCFADGFWLQADSTEVAPGTLSERQAGPGIALAGLVLMIGLDRAWATAKHGQTEKRDGGARRRGLPSWLQVA
jgi:hypothetical protein